MKNYRVYISSTVESVSIRWEKKSGKSINVNIIGVRFLIQDAVLQQLDIPVPGVQLES